MKLTTTTKKYLYLAMSCALVACGGGSGDKDRAFFAHEEDGEKIDFSELQSGDYLLEGIRILGEHVNDDYAFGTEIRVNGETKEILSNQCQPNQAVTKLLNKRQGYLGVQLNQPARISGIFTLDESGMEEMNSNGFTFSSLTFSSDPSTCVTEIAEYSSDRSTFKILEFFVASGIDREGLDYVLSAGEGKIVASVERLQNNRFRINYSIRNSSVRITSNLIYSRKDRGSLVSLDEAHRYDEWYESEDSRSEEGVIVFDETGRSSEMSREEFESSGAGSSYNKQTYDSFSSIAKKTGGKSVYMSPTAAVLPQVVDKVMTDVKFDLQPGKPLDIAILLDATGSMVNDIEAVKREMSRVIAQVADLSREGYDPRIALMTYKDSTDPYITKVHQDFTADHDLIDRMLNDISVNGGGDTPEAVLDALRDAKEELSWRPGAQKKVILIGDAPPQLRTCKEPYCDQDQVLREISRAGMNIVVYPIVTTPY